MNTFLTSNHCFRQRYKSIISHPPVRKCSGLNQERNLQGCKQHTIQQCTYNVFLAIASNIPQRLKTAFVLQGHVL